MLIEKQRFKQVWLWVLLVGLTLLLFYMLVQQVVFNTSQGDHPAPDIVLVFLCLMMFGVCYLFYNVIVLKIYIDEKNLVIKFPPFEPQRIIPLSDIEEAKIIKYSPLKEYGGWGFRHGKNGMAYNIGGNLGLSISLKTGKHLLIGIQNTAKYKGFTFIKTLSTKPN